MFRTSDGLKNTASLELVAFQCILLMPMRRAPAIFLLALFSFSLICSPMLAPAPYAKVPTCCRKAGKHHCETAIQITSSSGPILQPGTCALFPTAKLGPAGQASSMAAVQPADFGFWVSHGAPEPLVDSLCRSSYSRAGQKRGPPPSLA